MSPHTYKQTNKHIYLQTNKQTNKHTYCNARIPHQKHSLKLFNPELKLHSSSTQLSTWLLHHTSRDLQWLLKGGTHGQSPNATLLHP